MAGTKQSATKNAARSRTADTAQNPAKNPAINTGAKSANPGAESTAGAQQPAQAAQAGLNGHKGKPAKVPSKKASKSKAPAKPAAIPTLAHTLGEIVWLMTRSPLHKHLKIGDLEWLLMPAILMNQFRLFRAGEQVVGLALWAYLTPEQAAEMGKAGKIKPEDWRFGTDVLQVVKDQQAGKNVELAEPELKDGEVELWLVDFIVPFANAENKLAQACMADLVRGPLKDRKLKMHKTDPKTGQKTVIELGAS